MGDVCEEVDASLSVVSLGEDGLMGVPGRDGSELLAVVVVGLSCFSLSSKEAVAPLRGSFLVISSLLN